MRTHLPVFDERCLDQVEIAAPCTADWSRMRGDDRVRHCPECRLNVYNLSQMTRREAAALIASREGRVCVRLYQRSDGTLITRSCRERLRAARRRGLVAFGVALALVCITQLGLRVAGLHALLSWYQERRSPPVELTDSMMLPMGEMRAPVVMGKPPAPPSPPPPELPKKHSHEKMGKPRIEKMGKVQSHPFMGAVDL